MKLVRVLLLAVFALALTVCGAGVASAAKAPLPTPQFTSAVAVDTRTVTLSWTAVKGADHYVVSGSPARNVYTAGTTVTIGDLYPGDNATFAVRAETKRNVPSGTDWVSVALASEGPLVPSAYAVSADTVKIWWGSGLGCIRYELARLLPDGSYSEPLSPTFVHDDRMWEVSQTPSTTESYAVRCVGDSGLWSTWSPATSVTTPEY